ncbi:MAG: hypothetical protein AABZ57_03840, partial [Candidatus Margulisiibacteriota bacterium]
AFYASPWFTGKKPVNAFYYHQPSKDFVDAFPAAYSSQAAYAEAGRELISGLNPALMNEFLDYDPDGYHPIAEGFIIQTAADLKLEIR